LSVSGSVGRAATSVPPLSGFGVGVSGILVGLTGFLIEGAVDVGVLVDDETTQAGITRSSVKIKSAARTERLEGSTNAPCARNETADGRYPTYHESEK